MFRLLHVGALGLSNVVALACLGLAAHVTSSLGEHSASPATSTTFGLAISVISLVLLAPMCVRTVSI
jgi:hypothetical protein